MRLPLPPPSLLTKQQSFLQTLPSRNPDFDPPAQIHSFVLRLYVDRKAWPHPQLCIQFSSICRMLNLAFFTDVLGSVTVIYIFMHVCNNIQEKEATQVYHNHIAVPSWIQLARCTLSAPTLAKVTLAIRDESLAEGTIFQTRFQHSRIGRQNRRSSCDFHVFLCQSSMQKSLERQITVLRPWSSQKASIIISNALLY